MTRWLSLSSVALLLSSPLLSACYPDDPPRPPCFEDGVNVTRDEARGGAYTVPRCCAVGGDASECVARFSVGVERGELSATPELISAFSVCEPLEGNDLGRCVLNLTEENAECRVGRDCPSGFSCCPREGDSCEEMSAPRCALCVEGGC